MSAAQPADRDTKILITQPLPQVAIDWLLEQGAHLYYGYESEDWRQDADDIRALVYYSIPIGRELFDALPNLEFIGKRGAGIDRIDLPEAKRRGIKITSVSGANSNAVAEHAVMLLFAATRGVVVRDAVARAGRFDDRFQLPLVNEIAESRLGMIGFGNIGRRIAHMLRAGFDCEIGYFDPYVEEGDDRVRALDARRFPTLSALMEWAQNALVVAPLTPQTRGMVAAAELELLGPEGVLVIVSRGGIVDEDALADALAQGKIRGAGVDVYEGEPPRPDHPFFDLDNMVLTPHVAGATVVSRNRSSLLVCQQVWALLHGEEAPLVGDEQWMG